MVYIPQQRDQPPLRINAYLTTPLIPSELNKIHLDFEFGSNAKFEPDVELYIQDNPVYHGKSHSEIRHAETQDGRDGDFLLIDQHAVSDQAVWYIGSHADQPCVDFGVAESIDVLFQILIKTSDVPMAAMNYDFEGSIADDLGEITALPITENFSQTEPFSYNLPHRLPRVSIRAEPDDFEESTDMALRTHHQITWPRPNPDTGLIEVVVDVPARLVRLKADVARTWGLKQSWVIPKVVEGHPTEGQVKFENGEEKWFPKGTVRMMTEWVSDVTRPSYKRLEGSL